MRVLKPSLKPEGPCVKRYLTLPRHVLPFGPARVDRDRSADRTRPHRATLPPHDTAVAVSGLRQGGTPAWCGTAPVNTCAVRVEANGFGGGGPPTTGAGRV